jgi:hypothetical protein
MLALSSNGLGINLNPVKAVKTGARLVTHPGQTIKAGARAGVFAVKHPLKAGKFVAREAGSAAKQVGSALKTGILKPTEWVASTVTKPLRTRVHTLRDRRARKIAWDKRKSRTPNAQERGEAKAWTKRKLHSSGPQGYLLALFAGPVDDYVTLAGMDVYDSGLGFDPATASVIAASIPVFMAILNVMLSKANKSGEAPVDPTGQMPGAAQDAAAAAPGVVDMEPAQDAAAAAEDAAAAAQDVAEGGDGSGGGSGMVKLPGGVRAKRSHLMLGAAVLAGVIVLAVVMKKKKD